MKKYLYIIVLLALPLLLISAGKNDFIGMLQKYLNTYNVLLPQEKVYIQTDKTYYKPSETIWYKTFIVNANDNTPSRISDIVYVELRDPWGNVLEKHEHRMLEGVCDSRFNLGEEAPGGLYKMVAYTNWMKNWGEETFFSKEITVQKVITPRLLLKVDFEKRAYGAGDEVVAKLKVTDLDNVKTNNSSIKSIVRIGGVAIQNIENITQNGEADIKFKLPQDLNTSDGILQIVVQDRGTEESITRSIPIVLNKIAVSFFPEGGDLVKGVHTKVGFEALNEFGKGADISGNIIDDKGVVITHFQSFHLGMGAFEFTPQAGRKYYAKITVPQGDEELKPLPEVLKKGYVLNLKSKDQDKLQWNIYAPRNVSVNLVGQIQGEIYYRMGLSLKKGLNTIDVPTGKFPVGIAVFTLFDENNQETCERLVYLNADKGLNIELKTDKEIYLPGENVALTVQTTDKEGKPIAANLGLSVVDEQLLSLADDKQDNILSYLLFSSELKGKIQEPYFYFDETETKAKDAIDYLMLTHGWRRFTWGDVQKPLKDHFTEFPEKQSSIYGYVLDKDGQSAQTEVFVLESGGRMRVAKVNTTKEGHFVFHNVDLSGNVFITTKLPNQVYLFNGKPVILKATEAKQGKDIDLVNPESVEENNIDEVLISERSVLSKVESFDYFDNDNSSLDEVVVVGYGVQKKASLTGAITSVAANDIMVGFRDVTSALSSVAPGLVSDTRNISIRGVSSIMSGSNPLVVIDGVPVSESSSMAMSSLNPTDLESISIMKDAPATALYGSRAANGVVFIQTKSSRNRLKTKYKYGEPNYGGVLVKKREFYTSLAFDQRNDNKNYDNSTVYWNGSVRTNNKGEALIYFRNNLQSSTFRITAEGISSENGLIGSATEHLVTRKPFSIDAKTPLFAGVGDLIKIPVMVRNNTDQKVMAYVTMNLNENLYFDKDDNTMQLSANKDVVVEPNESKTVYFSVRTGINTGEFNISISANNGECIDKIGRKLTVRSINFPYQFTFSGIGAGQTETLNLSGYLPETLSAEAVSYSDVVDELFDGVESIFREPYGCFEQVSSSTFPNIFAMQLLNATEQEKSDVSKKAMKYLEAGYKKLAAYEVSGGGFEWYGGSPAHEVLSAYGLVEFYEMGKVYNGVDQKMMDRTFDFILSRRNDKGGFSQNRGKYGFSAAPENVNNAYIVYALTETGYANTIDGEYNTSLTEAINSEDMYRMALMANAAFNNKDQVNYIKLIGKFKEFIITKKDLSKLKSESTIVRSYGEGAQRETVAFWMMALLKDKENTDMGLVEKCLQFINAGRSNGSFGSTQATSICLQALTKYAEKIGTYKTEGAFCLDVNGESICKDITRSKVRIPFASKLKVGQNKIGVKYTGVEKYPPYAVTVSWQAKIPATSKLCPLKLTTKLAENTVKVNETVRLTVGMQNVEKEGRPMSIAIIGIPGGLSLQPWQLKELQEKGIYDFYEIINDNLVIYYREFGPSELKTINLDLKAEIPGEYKGVASSAYQYYMNEHKYWIEGLSVNIIE